MKGRSFLLLFLVSCFWMHLHADEKITYRYIDSLSYQLYSNQKWDSLAIVGKLALKNNIDYYYLRMRLGVADYERGKYISSITHFKQALVFDNYSNSAKNYLYYSQLYAEKKTMAYRFSSNFSKNTKEQLGIRIRTVDNISLLGGYSFTDNFSKNGDIDLLEEGATFGSQLLMGNMAIASVGIGLNFSPTVSLTGSISFENIQKRNRFQYIEENWDKRKAMFPPPGSWRNDFFTVEEEVEKSFDSFIRQFEFYLNAKVQMDDGWSFNLFTNILYINLTQYDAVLTSSIHQDTLSYNAMSGRYQFVNLEEFEYEFIPSDTSFVNVVAGLNLQKDFNFVIVNLTGSISKLYNANQFQAGISVTYYPFGSHVFYGRTGGFYFSQVRLDNTAEDRFIFNQMLGFKISRRTWLEAEYYSGDLNNTNIKQGLIVYNLPDKINYTLGVNLHIFVNQHLSIHLMYDYYNKSGAFFNYGGSDGEAVEYNFNYQTQNILGGIKWTF